MTAVTGDGGGGGCGGGGGGGDGDNVTDDFDVDDINNNMRRSAPQLFASPP